MATISKWKASDYIKNEQDAKEYLKAVAEYDDPKTMQTAIEYVNEALHNNRKNH